MRSVAATLSVTARASAAVPMVGSTANAEAASTFASGTFCGNFTPAKVRLNP